jgi:Papain-like cysteine protease AvrRpt2
MSTFSRRSALALIGSAAASSFGTMAIASPVNKVVDAKPFAQTKDWSCWAAAAVILMRWKDGVNYSEADVAAIAGANYTIAFNADTGLKGTQFADFASRLGLKTDAPQNYTPAGYENLLKSYGPIWIAANLGSVLKPQRHVRVLRGVTGDGTFDGSTAWVLDPNGGTNSQMSLTEFSRQIELIAKAQVDKHLSLFPQVIRFG